MRSRSVRERLGTFKSRKELLTIHINYKTWIPTPYVSFTTSPFQVEDLADLRAQRRYRGPHTLTVVNPNNRIRAGLPVLHVADEMKYYDIADPYGKSNEYYEDHYICLWEVTEREIVGYWDWNDLVANKNWYEEVIMPAFSRETAPTSSRTDAFDLSALLHTLPSRSLVWINMSTLIEPLKPQSILQTQLTFFLAGQTRQAKIWSVTSMMNMMNSMILTKHTVISRMGETQILTMK